MQFITYPPPWCDVTVTLMTSKLRDLNPVDYYILYDIYMILLTILPEFFGTFRNFKGLSRKKYEVIRDAELSRIPNPVPNLSRFNVKLCQASSSWSKCSWSFWRFCLSEMPSMSSKCIKCIFGRGGAPDPSGGSYNAPPDAPSPYLSPSAFRSTSWKVSGISIIDLWSP